MGISRTIKAKIDYSDLSAQAFAQRADAFYVGLVTSKYFPKPPFPLQDFRATLDKFRKLIVKGVDSKNGRLQRDSVREQLAKIYRFNAYYVTHVADGDHAIFQTSNLEAIPTQRATAQPLQPLRIKKVKHAESSGSVYLTLPPAKRLIKRFDISVREADSELPPESGRVIPSAGSKGPVLIDGLTPGKRYIFQIRGQNAVGTSDWSQPVSLIVV
jgi:hypothetical protein